MSIVDIQTSCSFLDPALPGRLKVSSCTRVGLGSVGRVVLIIALGACFSGLGGGSTHPLRSDSLAGAFREGLCALCLVAEASAQKEGCLQLLYKYGMLSKGVKVIGSRFTIAPLRIAQVGWRRRVGIGIPAHGRNTGRCARRVATTFSPNTFLDSGNQSEIRNEIGCYTYHNPPYRDAQICHRKQ